MPEQQNVWQKINDTLSSIAQFYGFQRIDTSIMEDSELYIKGTGESSEIVQKQMYTLKTAGGDSLTLRPEMTPGIIRAYLEHGMPNLASPMKLYASGPVFRRERPQSGRYRQFHQFDLETIGEQDPVLDVQIIQFCAVALQSLHVGPFIIHINSIGCNQCRPHYKKALKDFYRSKLRQVCADCRARYKTNVLRILDCKDEKCQRVRTQVPPILDYLCEECHNHFKLVLEYMDATGFSYIVNHYLVRGLDYYTKTVFEIFAGDVSTSTEQTPVALAGGGRYDGLVRLLGGKDTPAVGMAMGMERIMNILEEKKATFGKEARIRVFLVQLGDLAKKKSLGLMERFRLSGIPVQESLGRASIKSQLRIADKVGAEFALILGQKEAIDGTVIVREMENGIQETVPLEQIVSYLKKRFAG